MTTEIININTTRLLSVDDCIKEQMQALLNGMHKLGQPAVIHKDVWRSPELQELKFKQGVSKARWGYHCATRNGKPASLACDIVHAEYLWFEKNHAVSKIDEYYWLCLGHCAREVGLDWGGVWFRDWPNQSALDKIKFIESRADSLDVSGLETTRHFGWDVAHVEVKGVSSEEARLGWRIYNGKKFQVKP